MTTQTPTIMIGNPKGVDEGSGPDPGGQPNMKNTRRASDCSPLKKLRGRHNRGLIVAGMALSEFTSNPVFAEKSIEPGGLNDGGRAGQIHAHVLERATQDACSED